MKMLARPVFLDCRAWYSIMVTFHIYEIDIFRLIHNYKWIWKWEWRHLVTGILPSRVVSFVTNIFKYHVNGGSFSFCFLVLTQKNVCYAYAELWLIYNIFEQHTFLIFLNINYYMGWFPILWLHFIMYIKFCLFTWNLWYLKVLFFII